MYKLGEYSLARPFEVTQLFLLHRGIKLLGKQYGDAIRQKGEALDGIEDKVIDGFTNWWSNPSPASNMSSTSNVPSISGRQTISEATTMEPVDEAQEAEPQDLRTSTDQGRYESLKFRSAILISETTLDFGDSLSALEEDDPNTRIKRYLKTMQDNDTPAEKICLDAVPVDIFPADQLL